MGLTAHASAEEASQRQYDLPAGDAATTLRRFSEQSGQEIIYPVDQVIGIKTNAVRGRLTAREALDRMLEKTVLIVVYDEQTGALGVKRAPPAQPAKPVIPAEDARSSSVIRIDGAAIELQALVVTGSNIRRIDTEGVLPVTVLSRETMEARSAATPVEMLTSLPVLTSVPINESNSGSTTSRGDAASIDLRGIGPSSTLILLNGRRLVPNPTSGTFNYSPNVNQLPTQGISSIEVLRDGASSIYGSDAVAGVINYIMRRDFRGTEVKTRYGYAESGGEQNVQTTITYGRDFAGGRGRWMSTTDWMYREAIFLRNRHFSANADHSSEAPAPWNVPGSPFDLRTSTGFWPTFRVGSSTQSNYFRPVDGVPTLTTVAPTRGADPEFFMNGNRFFIGLPRASRFNTFNWLEFDVSDRITAFADLSYYYADSVFDRAPIGIAAPSADQPIPLAVDSPFNPYGSRFYHPEGAPNVDGTPRLVGTPRPVFLTQETIKDLHSDWVNIASQVYRFVGGLRGKLTDTWNWEVGALLSRARSSEHALYNVRETLLHQAARRNDFTAFNPFGYTFKVENGAVVADQPYKNPQGVMDTFVEEWRRDGMGHLGSLDARAAGRILTLWSGDASLAAGGEYREEQYRITQPPFASVNPPESGLDPQDNDFIGASPRPNHDGERTVSSFYSEIFVPLVAPKNAIPLVNRLEVMASVRHERYSDFGHTTKPKVGFIWKPWRSVMVRGSYNEGFTAPSLPLLYSPSQFTAGGGAGNVDPYRNPVTQEGAYPIRTYQVGNPTLKPINSEGKSGGIVFDVPKIKGLSITADYWEINQTDVINSFNAIQVANNDAALLRAYTAQQLAAGVPAGSIGIGSGATYKGDPAVVRFAPTVQDIATYAAYNAANPNNQLAVAGLIQSLRTSFQNLSEGFVSGWDFGLSYTLPSLTVGRISINSEATYLIESYTTRPGVVPVVNERLNVDGNARLRHSTTLSWRKEPWSGGVSAYYIGSYSDRNASTTAAVYESLGRPAYISQAVDGGQAVYRYVVDDVTTFNAFLTYRFGSDANKYLRHSAVRLGVVNLRNTPPPLATGLHGYSTVVHGNLLVGRLWTLELTRQF